MKHNVMLAAIILLTFFGARSFAADNTCSIKPPLLSTMREIARRYGMSTSAVQRALVDAGLLEDFQSRFTRQIDQDSPDLYVDEKALGLIDSIDLVSPRMVIGMSHLDGQMKSVTCLKIFDTAADQAHAYTKALSSKDITELREDESLNLCRYILIDKQSVQNGFEAITRHVLDGQSNFMFSFEGGWICQILDASV